MRLHAEEKQEASGWTGFNVSVRRKVQVSQDVIAYLPTTDAPATDMATVHDVLVQSLKIKSTPKLKSIVLVFDQALYAKATEVQWKQSERFKDILLRVRVFHTACTLLSIIGKRFQDASLKERCVESVVIADGSVAGVLDGRRYNRGVRLHKIMYEALMRPAWQRFVAWIQENHKESKSTVDSFFSGEFYVDICETQFKKHMTCTLYCRLCQTF